MGKNSGIEWTDHTWNPWQGCCKVSEGCRNCYMYREKKRYGQDPAQVVRSKPLTFNKPLSWDSGKVFVCSWSDFFIKDADPWRAEAWDIMRQTPHLTYQILTKRPWAMVRGLPEDWDLGWPNVWLLVSAENQEVLDWRVPILFSVPAVVSGVSLEPLLSEIDIGEYLGLHPGVMPEVGRPLILEGVIKPVTILDWVIVGGESGPDARPMKIEWVGKVIAQCRAAGVPVFVKQLGKVLAKELGLKGAGRDMEKWPESLRVREFPNVTGRYTRCVK